jgi:hypothetical protein
MLPFTMHCIRPASLLQQRLAGLRPNDCAEHGLKLCASFGQFLFRLRIGNDPNSGVDACVGSVDLCRSDANRPGSVAFGIDPSDRTCIAASVEAFEFFDQCKRCVSGHSANRRCRVQRSDKIENRSDGLRELTLETR